MPNQNDSPISNSLHVTFSKTVICSSLHLKNIEDLWCKTVSGKFFEVNKGSNQHQKFIVDEDHDDEGYGVESDGDANDGDAENGNDDGDDENLDDSDNEDQKFVCPARRAIPQTGHKPDWMLPHR